jgi:hypothetical protein
MLTWGDVDGKVFLIYKRPTKSVLNIVTHKNKPTNKKPDHCLIYNTATTATKQHNTAQHSTAQHSTTQHKTTQFNTI